MTATATPTARCDRSFFNAQAIQALDPFGLDDALADLPALNARADVPALTALLQHMTAQYKHLTLLDAESTHATMRDFGIVLGSLKRHGVEPLSVVPHLEPILLDLGGQHDMVPRDTVLHYTVWNPDGERRRLYTGDPQERELQDAVTNVFPHLSASLALSDSLADLDPRDVRFAPLAMHLARTSEVMVDTIDRVTQHVSPIFFAQTMRPYFEEIHVNGRAYLGPAAAQVPLWLIDITLWASDRSHPAYEHFLQESLQYSPPSWRAFYAAHSARPSLVTKVSALLASDAHQHDRNLLRSADALTALLRTLKVFRGRHLGIARRAYAEDVRLYEHGSGGAPIELLKTITQLTKENEAAVRARVGGRPGGHAPARGEVGSGA
ncbi:Domain of unknown function DUF1864 [Deinococcus maricopensis DSM 21211]|uniref:Monodechloroaminopyrrolnitrin synthase PrnB n=2 Tax=Deinococcus TaxID=1298 RepID=E8U445_DEIML|nr:Domain of unknown function DUF1864 [Deinococcus maricopensis DSM 21211]